MGLHIYLFFLYQGKQRLHDSDLLDRDSVLLSSSIKIEHA